MPGIVLVRYGELALKSAPVRREFERALRQNIVELFAAAGVSCRIRADHGHLYVEADDGAQAARLLTRVFGVTSVSEVVDVEADPVVITEGLLVLAEPRLTPGRRFAVRARRTGTHAFSSQALAASIGAAVLDRWPERHLVVDLDDPEVELAVEVRGPRAYLSLDRRSGPGGLPLGVAGRVVALVDGPRGALGAFLMMKRGCRCALVTGNAEGVTAVPILQRFDPRLAFVAGGDAPDRVLEEVATRSRADALVLPLSVDAFPEARARWGEHVVFSPTIAFTDPEVAERWTAVEALG